MSIGQDLTKLMMAGSAAAAFAVAPAFAQEVMVDEVVVEEEVPSINNGAVSFSLGMDLPSIYIFRGYEIEDSDLILQPYVEATFAITEGVDFYIGSWNSVHWAETGAAPGASQDEWYESDLYAGVSFAEVFDKRISVDMSIIHYMYPSNAFGDYKEFDIAIGFDDSELFDKWAFSPYFLMAFEFDTTAPGDGNDAYGELGGEWAFAVVDSADYPVELTVPFKIGLSLDDYYLDSSGDDEFFGYFSVGANLGVPLKFIPADYGVWTASAGLTLYLNNGDVVGLSDTGSDVALVGTLGIAMEY